MGRLPGQMVAGHFQFRAGYGLGYGGTLIARHWLWLKIFCVLVPQNRSHQQLNSL
jgi:hypothetical protein